MALTVAVRTREDFDGADRIDADFGRFPQAEPAPRLPTALEGAMPQASM